MKWAMFYNERNDWQISKIFRLSVKTQICGCLLKIRNQLLEFILVFKHQPVIIIWTLSPPMTFFMLTCHPITYRHLKKNLSLSLHTFCHGIYLSFSFSISVHFVSYYFQFNFLHLFTFFLLIPEFPPFSSNFLFFGWTFHFYSTFSILPFFFFDKYNW